MQTTAADLRRRSRKAWGNAIGQALRHHKRRSQGRRDYRQLLTLDERMLRDIGITRDMVRYEMHRSYRWFP
jgi:uncharacterized protein YjiS (DUF1127 family)